MALGGSNGLKRVIGRLVVVGLLSTGVALVEASPSSALPRNGCLDEAHWWAQVSQLSQAAEHAYEDYTLWQNANIYDYNGQQRWYVILDNGHVVDSDDFGALHSQQLTQYNRWQSASSAALDFYNNMAICEL